MPQSRKRPGHHPHKQTADIPVSQRVKGKVIWAVLLAIFAFIIAYFAGAGYIVLVIAAVCGGVIGYLIGRAMEKDA